MEPPSVASLHGGGSTVSTFSGPVSLVATSAISVDGGATLQLTNPTAALSLNGNILYALTAGTLASAATRCPGRSRLPWTIRESSFPISRLDWSRPQTPPSKFPRRSPTTPPTPVLYRTAWEPPNWKRRQLLQRRNHHQQRNARTDDGLTPFRGRRLVTWRAASVPPTRPIPSRSAAATAQLAPPTARWVSRAALPSTTSSPLAVARARLSPVLKSKTLRATTPLPAT